MSLLLRFLACALIVAATSVLAAFAWDHSEPAAIDSAANPPDPRPGASPLPSNR